MCWEQGHYEESIVGWNTGLAFRREGMAGGGTWACWPVGVVEVGRVEDAQGMCVSGQIGRLRAEPWEGPKV